MDTNSTSPLPLPLAKEPLDLLDYPKHGHYLRVYTNSYVRPLYVHLFLCASISPCVCLPVPECVHWSLHAPTSTCMHPSVSACIHQYLYASTSLCGVHLTLRSCTGPCVRPAVPARGFSPSVRLLVPVCVDQSLCAASSLCVWPLVPLYVQSFLCAATSPCVYSPVPEYGHWSLHASTSLCVRPPNPECAHRSLCAASCPSAQLWSLCRSTGSCVRPPVCESVHLSLSAPTGPCVWPAHLLVPVYVHQSLRLSTCP